MNIGNQNRLQARINQDGAGSATAFAAITGGRWVLVGGMIGWSNAPSTTIGLYEIDSTNSGCFLQFQTSATNGAYSFFFGPIGIQASSSYSSRMVFNSGQAGTWTALFSGYSTGQ